MLVAQSDCTASIIRRKEKKQLAHRALMPVEFRRHFAPAHGNRALIKRVLDIAQLFMELARDNLRNRQRKLVHINPPAWQIPKPFDDAPWRRF
ncbi:hypothetical protein A3J43_03980 [Candidatus Uhrbacteria bacterium RIFCSPHIGHO2_12_FULL_54_23]|uniref:Uncharacterized protein n=1 Tax=Candidatus Uhrbacteria bacterium RIFCSPHIGHO2_12_FULL_54_23 TaxID=1802397 RepID=A0A1F7UJV3_9BACT|nr:MAG: hypothetical protein A3J43_03980 [Candidatus Uhrbacteria bacterium RIFCSPHIGHO2_12_FULL_54_23]